MAALTTQLCGVLRLDPVLATMVGQRIYDNRPIKRGGIGGTPDAFDQNGMVLPSVVVMDEGAVAAFDREDAAEQMVNVWIHAPMVQATIDLIDSVIYPGILRLLDHEYVATNGTGVELVLMDRNGIQEDPTIANTYVDYMRFTATRLWR